MNKTAIVILNYLNYLDTIECIDSIIENEYDICGIVVVDNHSNNHSCKILQDKYKDRKEIHIIQTKCNLGFAKGNNYGIRYARERLKAEYVLVVNNDTIFIDNNYITKMECHEENIGVIGSRILLRKNKIQNMVKTNLHFPFLIIRYLSFWCDYRKYETLQYLLHEMFINNMKQEQILHGCALMFTPKFFEYYSGFYPKTFLYCEEEILTIMLKKVGLKQGFVKETMLYHKEDKSSEMSFQNKEQVKLKYLLKSYKHIIFVKMIPYQLLVKL
jgi:GT2 family glycosyltransferase